MSSAAAMIASDRQDRRKVTVAALLSLLLHLLLILFIAIISSLTWKPSVQEEEEVMEMTMIPEPAPVRQREEPVYVATTADQAVEEAPENALFESDNNTRAASDALPDPALSDLPAVAGEENEFLELRQQDYTPGPQPIPSTPSIPATATPAVQPVEEQPPVEKVAEKPVEEEPVPEEARPEELAMLRPQEVPARQPRPETQEVRRAEPMPPSPPGYQPQARTTRIQGGISTRGRASLEAAATPLGRFKKMLSDAIGSRWYYYVNNEIGLLNIGTVVIRFTVHEDGSVKGIKVLSNTSNESFATCSIRSIVEAEIPPIPPDVAAVLEGGKIEVDYTFTILSN